MGFFDFFTRLLDPSDRHDLVVHVLTDEGEEWWTDWDPCDDRVVTMDRRGE